MEQTDPIEKKVIRKKDSKVKDIEPVDPEVIPEAHYLLRLNDFIRKRYDIRYNILKLSLEFKPKDKTENYKDVDDQFYNDLWIDLALSGFKKGDRDLPDAVIQKVIKSTRFTQEHHPLQHYLQSLKWDKKDHIKALASTLFIANDPDLCYDGKTQTELFPDLLRRWLINSAAISLGKNVAQGHVMLILEGGQGKGKTTWLNNLCPPVMEEYRFCGHILPSISEVDTANLVAEKWFVNIDDQLQGLFSKDFNSIKSMITIPDVTNRKSYERNSKKRQRTASFLASVNGREIFTDSENRRYMVFCIDNAKPFCFDDEKLKKIDMSQVWAQVVDLINKGEQCYFTGAEMQAINGMNLMFNQVKPEEEWLMKCFVPTDHSDPNCSVLQGSEMLSMARKVSGLNLNHYWFQKALDKMGFEQVRKKCKEYNNQVRKIYHVRELHWQPYDNSDFMFKDSEQELKNRDSDKVKRQASLIS